MRADTTLTSRPRIVVRLPAGLRAFCADLALALAAATVLALFSVSSLLLEKVGYHYETSGGLPWEKFHPATMLSVAALGLRCLAAPEPLTAASRLLGREPLLLLYLFAVFLTAAHAALVSHTPVTPLVDTFVLPFVVVVLFRDLDPRIARALGLAICGLMLVNACIGLTEYLSGWRLLTLEAPAGVSADPTDPNTVFDWRAALAREWRATALLGHPLQNGVITGAFMLCLAAPGAAWIAPLVRFPILAASMVAMSAFGARVSLVLSFLGIAAFFLYEGGRRMAAGRGVGRRALALCLFAIPFAVAGMAVLADSGFFDRLILRFTTDQGSANARIVMWDLFDPLSWYGILIGPDQDVIETWQRLLGLEFGIESFWVALPLTYGLLISLLLFIAIGVFVWRVVRQSGSGALAVFGFFFAVASTSTSLSSKTTGLAMVALMAILLVRKPQGKPL